MIGLLGLLELRREHLKGVGWWLYAFGFLLTLVY